MVPRAASLAPSVRSPDMLVLARALIALTKPRLAVMSVLTTAVAYLQARPTLDGAHAICVLGATLLSAAGALGLNQWRERDADALMRRTRGRPLPRQQLSPAVALGWTLLLGTAGVAGLAWAANGLAAFLSALTIAIYAWVYTPLKRRSRWATEIGALSGALPPLIGAAAATGGLTTFGVFLAGILVLWQMPHFFAIGWACRADYRAAGFPLLPAIDATGVRTSRTCVGYTLVLVATAALAGLAGWVPPWSAAVSAVAALPMVRRAREFAAHAAAASEPGRETRRDEAARSLFLASLTYLPLVLLTAVVEALV